MVSFSGTSKRHYRLRIIRAEGLIPRRLRRNKGY